MRGGGACLSISPGACAGRGLRCLSLEDRSLVARRALLLDTRKVSVWKTLNSLTEPQRVRIRTKEKEFPFENMGEFAVSRDPDRSGCPGARGFRTPTGQQTTGPLCKREDQSIPAGTSHTQSAVLLAAPPSSCSVSLSSNYPGRCLILILICFVTHSPQPPFTCLSPTAPCWVSLEKLLVCRQDFLLRCHLLPTHPGAARWATAHSQEAQISLEQGQCVHMTMKKGLLKVE